VPPLAAGSALVGLLVAFGPLPLLYAARPDDLMGESELQTEYASPRPLRAEEIPSFYRRLAAEPDAFAIAEVVQPDAWYLTRLERYQRIHQKDLVFGFVRPSASEPAAFASWPFGPGFRFQRFVDLGDAASLAARQVRYAIVHKDLHEEIPWRSDNPPPFVPETEPIVRALSERFGPPVFDGRRVAVFRVDAR
jgi:hypothetical protein